MSVIKEVLTERGWEVDNLNRLKPTQQKLNELGFFTINQWNKALDGELDLTLTQARAISEWLNIPFERLLSLPASKTA